jgi:hypothetical protein
MPVSSRLNADWVPVRCYEWPAQQVIGEGVADALREWRKAAIKDRDEWRAAQKTFAGQGDRDFVRFCKDEANRYLRYQRACTLMIPWLGEPDVKQEAIVPYLWPIELTEELDDISRRIILRFG